MIDMDTRDTRRLDHPSPPPPESPASPPARLPGWARTLLPVVLMLPCAMAGTVLLLLPGYTGLLERPAVMVQLAAYAPFTAVVLLAYLLVSWALCRWVDRRPVGALGLRPGRRALLGLCLGCGISLLIGLVVAVSTRALGLTRSVQGVGPGDPAEGVGALAVLAMVLLVLLRAFVLQGIGEEVLFRGYLMQSLRPRPVLAVLIAAVAFTLPHLLSNSGQQSPGEHLLFLAFPFGFALSAGFLAVAMRSVWAAVGIHGGVHLATAAAALGPVTDGPAVWVGAGLLHAVIGAVIAVRIPRSRWAEVRRHGPYSRPAADGGNRPRG